MFLGRYFIAFIRFVMRIVGNIRLHLAFKKQRAQNSAQGHQSDTGCSYGLFSSTSQPLIPFIVYDARQADNGKQFSVHYASDLQELSSIVPGKMGDYKGLGYKLNMFSACYAPDDNTSNLLRVSASHDMEHNRLLGYESDFRQIEQLVLSKLNVVTDKQVAMTHSAGQYCDSTCHIVDKNMGRITWPGHVTQAAVKAIMTNMCFRRVDASYPWDKPDERHLVVITHYPYAQPVRSWTHRWFPMFFDNEPVSDYAPNQSENDRLFYVHNVGMLVENGGKYSRVYHRSRRPSVWDCVVRRKARLSNIDHTRYMTHCGDIRYMGDPGVRSQLRIFGLEQCDNARWSLWSPPYWGTRDPLVDKVVHMADIIEQCRPNELFFCQKRFIEVLLVALIIRFFVRMYLILFPM